MKKIWMTVFIGLILFTITGCNKENALKTKTIDYELNENGDFVINETEINDEITFYNVVVNNVDVQLIIVRASDGTIRTVFNTCQVCNPSPQAYFVREGDYLVCQNCGNKYHIDKLGLERGGCNPIPISENERRLTDEKLIIPSELLKSNSSKFENITL